MFSIFTPVQMGSVHAVRVTVEVAGGACRAPPSRGQAGPSFVDSGELYHFGCSSRTHPCIRTGRCPYRRPPPGSRHGGCSSGAVVPESRLAGVDLARKSPPICRRSPDLTCRGPLRPHLRAAPWRTRAPTVAPDCRALVPGPSGARKGPGEVHPPALHRRRCGTGPEAATIDMSPIVPRHRHVARAKAARPDAFRRQAVRRRGELRLARRLYVRDSFRGRRTSRVDGVHGPGGGTIPCRSFGAS